MERTRKQSSGQVRKVPLASIRPSPVNDSVYRPPSADDPDIQEMARSMREHGVLQALTITRDGFILSGHRRYCAATLAGLETVPVVEEHITRDDPAFPKLLVMHNQQRQKTVAEMLAEQVVQRSGEDAHRELVQHRIARSRRATAGVFAMVVDRKRSRSAISPAKQPMLDAVLAVLDELQDFWPLSLRTIHYNLLNDPPLRNASKPESRYRNNRQCYSDLSDLCTRARFAGALPFEAIHDPTRPAGRAGHHNGGTLMAPRKEHGRGQKAVEKVPQPIDEKPSAKAARATVGTKSSPPSRRDEKAKAAASTVGQVAAKAGTSMHKARQDRRTFREIMEAIPFDAVRRAAAPPATDAPRCNRKRARSRRIRSRATAGADRCYGDRYVQGASDGCTRADGHGMRSPVSCSRIEPTSRPHRSQPFNRPHPANDFRARDPGAGWSLVN